MMLQYLHDILYVWVHMNVCAGSQSQEGGGMLQFALKFVKHCYSIVSTKSHTHHNIIIMYSGSPHPYNYRVMHNHLFTTTIPN